jgi:hypothetical protein
MCAGLQRCLHDRGQVRSATPWARIAPGTLPCPPAGRLRERARANGRRDRAAGRTGQAGADTVYFHLYDMTDLDRIRLLGREVLPQLT